LCSVWKTTVSFTNLKFNILNFTWSLTCFYHFPPLSYHTTHLSLQPHTWCFVLQLWRRRKALFVFNQLSSLLSGFNS
jgi:hypothetical protein